MSTILNIKEKRLIKLFYKISKHWLWIQNEAPWIKSVNSMRPRQNGGHFADDTLKRFFLNGNDTILIKISVKFVPKGPFNNIPALDQIMAWRRPGAKPLSEPMMVRLPMHICVTRPQWVKEAEYFSSAVSYSRHNCFFIAYIYDHRDSVWTSYLIYCNPMFYVLCIVNDADSYNQVAITTT